MFLFCTFSNKVVPPILSVVYKMNEGRWEGERALGGSSNKQNRCSLPTGNVSFPRLFMTRYNQKEQHITYILRPIPISGS